MMRVTKKPVICSHSNSKALSGHPRNLTDAQFRALVHNGGCAGLNLVPDFLGLGRNVEAVADHAEHFLSLGGERNLCLGSDFDGVKKLPLGMRGVQDMGKLYEAMLRRGWREETVINIFFGNLLRFMEAAL